MVTMTLESCVFNINHCNDEQTYGLIVLKIV